MTFAIRKNWSICRTRKIHIYLWALAVYEHVIGDGEATLLILHLDDVLQTELDGFAREVIHGDPKGIVAPRKTTTRKSRCFCALHHHASL